MARATRQRTAIEPAAPVGAKTSMNYLISATEVQVLIELLRDHRERLTADQLRRLSWDPEDLVRDLLGKTTSGAIILGVR